MADLDKDWLTKGLIDFEYKKYVLLAYKKAIEKEYKKNMLFPSFSDVMMHYNNLISLNANKERIRDNMPKKISSADFKKLTYTYKDIITDDEAMKTLEEIMGYAIPQLRQSVDDGKTIYDFIEDNLDIEPVGLSPLTKDEGYVFIKLVKKKSIKIYNYRLTIFKDASHPYRGLNMMFVDEVRKGIGKTLESLKVDLVKKYKNLPNPATYFIHSNIVAPYEETILPISKRMFLRYISD